MNDKKNAFRAGHKTATTVLRHWLKDRDTVDRAELLAYLEEMDAACEVGMRKEIGKA